VAINGLDRDDVLLDAELRFEQSLANLETRFASLRTGKATPNLLDAVRVTYHGSPTPLNKLASIFVDKRDLVVRPFDLNDGTKITQAILTSGLGLSPMQGYYQIRVPIPPLSGDRQRELAKAAAQFAEEARIAMRNVRRDAIHKASRELNLSVDEWRVFENELERVSHEWQEKVNAALKEKSAAITNEDGRWSQADERRRWK